MYGKVLFLDNKYTSKKGDIELSQPVGQKLTFQELKVTNRVHMDMTSYVSPIIQSVSKFSECK